MRIKNQASFRRSIYLFLFDVGLRLPTSAGVESWDTGLNHDDQWRCLSRWTSTQSHLIYREWLLAVVFCQPFLCRFDFEITTSYDPDHGSSKQLVTGKHNPYWFQGDRLMMPPAEQRVSHEASSKGQRKRKWRIYSANTKNSRCARSMPSVTVNMPSVEKIIPSKGKTRVYGCHGQSVSREQKDWVEIPRAQLWYSPISYLCQQDDASWTRRDCRARNNACFLQ